MVKYVIMAYMMGFSGNKIFNRKDKSTYNCIKWGCITGSILVIIKVLLNLY